VWSAQKDLPGDRGSGRAGTQREGVLQDAGRRAVWLLLLAVTATVDTPAAPGTARRSRRGHPSRVQWDLREAQDPRRAATRPRHDRQSQGREGRDAPSWHPGVAGSRSASDAARKQTEQPPATSSPDSSLAMHPTSYGSPTSPSTRPERASSTAARSLTLTPVAWSAGRSTVAKPPRWSPAPSRWLSRTASRPTARLCTAITEANSRHGPSASGSRPPAWRSQWDGSATPTTTA
jgi:hypothetical protein